MTTIEANFDGLVGPTHNYGGLAFGNLASAKHATAVSNPKEAALQGLAKMRRVRDMGLVQGVLPPHSRPYLPLLRGAGFTGSDAEVSAAAFSAEPALFANAMSAAAMWTANAATVCPSADARDGRVHFTPANLISNLHRSLEPPTTARVLQAMFADEDRFVHHAPVRAHVDLGDEGAANHNRFCNGYGDAGAQLFVYGRRAFGAAERDPKIFPARQTREASEAIARLHGLVPDRTVFVRQHPAAIDAGAFHNDVVAVANRGVFFYHELAFQDPGALQDNLRKAAPDIDFHFIEVADADVAIADAVKSYLFNSQLVCPAGSDGPAKSNGMTLVLPVDAEETASTKACVDGLISGNGPITAAEYLDVRQSMRNGGGPACLRLRVVLSEPEQAAMSANVILSDELYAELESWIGRHYRDRLAPEDLGDPNLMDESFTALDQLTDILGLGSVYFFQR